MANQKKINTRQQQKYDTTERWEEAGNKGFVYCAHCFLINLADVLVKTGFIDGPDLFEQDDGFAFHAVCREWHMGGQVCFCFSACDCCHDSGGAVFIAGVVLQNEDRTDTALLTADHRT